MIKENKIKKYVVVIICLLGMLILSGKTENVFANDKKSKDMENSLLSFYIKEDVYKRQSLACFEW